MGARANAPGKDEGGEKKNSRLQEEKSQEAHSYEITERGGGSGAKWNKTRKDYVPDGLPG